MLIPHDFYGNMVGAYRIQHVLRRGRLSTLHLALHPIHQQNVALTTFTVSAQLSPEEQQIFLSRFTQEASILTTLRHPHIVTVNDYGEQDGVPYFVLPAVIADTLLARLRQGTRWDPRSALPILRQIAHALDYAHGRGVVHGGLKPACILLEEDNTARVTGFALERLLSRHGIDDSADQTWTHLLSVTGSFLGQLEYMAPECIQGDAASISSDIYSLGCILFALFNGEPPVQGTPFEMMAQQIQAPELTLRDTQPRLLSGLCEALDKVLQKALALDPARRYQSAGECIETFAQALIPYQDVENLYEMAEEVQKEEFQLPDDSFIIDATSATHHLALSHTINNENDHQQDFTFRFNTNRSDDQLNTEDNLESKVVPSSLTSGSNFIDEGADTTRPEHPWSFLLEKDPDATIIARPGGAPHNKAKNDPEQDEAKT